MAAEPNPFKGIKPADRKFTLVEKFLGYTNKDDITKLADGITEDSAYLVVGSKNVLIDSQKTVSIRNGYSLLGQSSTSSTISGTQNVGGSFGSYDFGPSSGPRSVRAMNMTQPFKDPVGRLAGGGPVTYPAGKYLQFYTPKGWMTMNDYNVFDSAFASPQSLFSKSTAISCDTWWDVDNNLEYMFMVDGSTNYYFWSGAVATVNSFAPSANSILAFNSYPTLASPVSRSLNISSFSWDTSFATNGSYYLKVSLATAPATAIKQGDVFTASTTGTSPLPAGTLFYVFYKSSTITTDFYVATIPVSTNFNLSNGDPGGFYGGPGTPGAAPIFSGTNTYNQVSNGSGYSVGLLATVNGGVGAQLQVVTADSMGGLLTGKLINQGSGYSVSTQGLSIGAATIAISSVGATTLITLQETVSPGVLGFSTTPNGITGAGVASYGTIILNGQPYGINYWSTSPSVIGITGTLPVNTLAGDILYSPLLFKTTSSLQATSTYSASSGNVNPLGATIRDMPSLDLLTNLNGYLVFGSNNFKKIFSTAANRSQNFLYGFGTVTPVKGGTTFVASNYTTAPQGGKDLFETARITGDGFSVTMAHYPTAFLKQDNKLYVSSGRNSWDEVRFIPSPNTITVSGTQITFPVEYVVAFPQMNTNGQAAQSQALTTSIFNNGTFISFEPTLSTIGKIKEEQGQLTPLLDNVGLKSISDNIKIDFGLYNFTGGRAFYFQDYIYISIPVSNTVIMYNLKYDYWEAPQTLPISHFSVINNVLVGHSAYTNESYTLFTGTNDNGFAILAQANFNYMNYGSRTTYKNFEEFFVEGYLSGSTSLTSSCLADFNNTLFSKAITINKNISFIQTADNPLGSSSLGSEPLGGITGTNPSTTNFLTKLTSTKKDFFKVQPQFSSNTLNASWELLSFGPEVKPSGNDTTIIKN